MKYHHHLLLLGLAVLATPTFAQSTLLSNFSDSVQPSQSYFFTGSWSDGSDRAAATFQQSTDSYSLTGVSADADSGMYSYFDTSLDLTGVTSLLLSAHAGSDNAAPSFSISLLDANNATATAVFSSASFGSSGFPAATASLTFGSTFDPSQVFGFVISGSPGDHSAISVDLKSLSATSASAVPEPSTYAAIFGGVALIGAVLRRRFAPAAAP